MDITQLALIAVFISVALIAGAAATLAMGRNTEGQRRLREVTSTGSVGNVVIPEVLPLTDNHKLSGIWEDLAALLPRSKKEMSRLKQRLERAGVKHPGAPIFFSLAEFVLPVLFGGAVYAIGRPEPPLQYLLIIAAAAAGFFLPGVWVERRLAARQRQIQNGLPDALDLLVVCIEAGSGLDQAIMKTSEEIAFAYPALGEELRILNSEIRAGKTRVEAFKSLAQRTKVDDVRALVAMLIQTDRFGTSVGQALRTHADTSRVKRRQRAEEAAQKIGVKLVFPLVLFFFPAFYVVVLGPAVIQFIHAFE